MIKLFLSLLSISLFFESTVLMQDEDVILKIINEDGSEKKVRLTLPSGPPPTGGTNAMLIKMVDKILKENAIDCPPTREKLTDNIWKCGNGKKVSTDNRKMQRLLNKAWESN